MRHHTSRTYVTFCRCYTVLLMSFINQSRTEISWLNLIVNDQQKMRCKLWLLIKFGGIVFLFYNRLEKQTKDFTNIGQFKDESEEFQFYKRSSETPQENKNATFKYYMKVPSHITDINHSNSPIVLKKFGNQVLPGNTEHNHSPTEPNNDSSYQFFF